ncbi:hypothetical protein RB596_000406 [Gaeumannomyces avenae]
MAANHEYAPEVAVQSYPEAVPQQHPQVYNVQGQQQAQQQPYYAPDAKPTYPPTVSSPPPTTTYSPYQASHANLASENGNGNGGVGGSEEKRRGGGGADRTVCGCTLIVFVLSVIIAVLAAGVIGLAAGTGIEASRASEASDSYQRLQASVSAAGLLAPSGTGSAPAASGTSCPRPETVVIDNGCASNASSVNGQSYTSFKLLSLATYTMQCNRDVNDFFGTTNVNATCAGVSFIPLWTNKTIALAGGAPGNCYLKRGPLEKKAFVAANAGTPVHGAIVDGGSG